jgi:hypothetical protein
MGMVVASSIAPVAFAQEYVGRYEVYAGYMFLDSPKISLFEPGFHLQAGMRAKTWLSLGIDYSRGTGNTVLTPNLATTAFQQQLNSVIGPLKANGLLPANYVPSLPLSSVTETFAAGPEFPYRRFNRITPYIRPSGGYIHEVATAHPNDTITRGLLNQIAPSGTKEDWTIFYGFGGGIAFNFFKHFSLVVQADFVHDHLFSDLLQSGRNTVRFSIGPGFQFGKNIRE